MAFADKPKRELTHAVCGGAMTLLRCSCVLLGRDVLKEGEDLCHVTGVAMGFDLRCLLAILGGRDDKTWACTAPECEVYSRT